MTDQNAKTQQNTQDPDSQLEALLDEAKKINQQIDETSKESKESTDDLETKVDKSIGSIEEFCADLDKIEKETEDELDKLILEQVENLASEE